ncbi:MAG: hypothetical protein EKK55_24525 [Rhodocyclaceae bacterium]|nr:MAG: hypothetical protein EKK55_24525 [Rhodocyclaceae bacterium]
MSRLFFILLLGGALAACCTPEETETDPGDPGPPCEEEVACEDLHDCPPSEIDCVLGVCTAEHVCEWVNLATVRTLPVDPDSGLPLGKHCRD